MGFRRLFAGLLLAGLLSGSQPLWSQAGREKVLEGNRNYSEGAYDKALELYREALEENPDSPAIRFNLGDAQFKKEEMEDAADSFSRALQTEDPGIKSRAQYNLGNSLYRQGKLQESLNAYREALKAAPGDRDAKHNLEFVLKQLQEQQQQNQDQQGEGEQDKDKNQDESGSGNEDQSQQGRQDQPEEQENQDRQDEEQQSQARNDRQDSGNPEQRPGDRQENRDQESRASGGRQEESSREDQAQASSHGAQPMSREAAERLLEALAQAQAGVRKKLEMRPGTAKVEKDW
ncbi:MAG: tetratricopeptide repeat protein [Acidobacteriota bacterium]|nr:tetratricopeptide repeat protein [Acidobacteriota bacterium]